MLALALVLLLASAPAGASGAPTGGQLRAARHQQQSRRRLLVDSGAAKALLPPLQAPRADLHDRLARSFYKSGDLGIARCSLLVRASARRSAAWRTRVGPARHPARSHSNGCARRACWSRRT